VVGDILSATTELADVYQCEGPNGTELTFCVFHTEFVDKDDERVLTSRRTRIKIPPDEVARLVGCLADGLIPHMTGQDINISSGRV